LTHDCCALEERGIPTVGLLSSQFKVQAEYQAVQLGATNIERIFVPHPISDCTTEQLYEKADVILDQILISLKSDMPISPIVQVLDTVAEEADDCGA